mmetsp:Transcript_13135/g.21065  ORF Transcript_13135/g.21065 Transcript_13135/m.21065 type:complete len:540 (-) Transcript_13135:2298-3917(-)
MGCSVSKFKHSLAQIYPSDENSPLTVYVTLGTKDGPYGVPYGVSDKILVCPGKPLKVYINAFLSTCFEKTSDEKLGDTEIADKLEYDGSFHKRIDVSLLKRNIAEWEPLKNVNRDCRSLGLEEDSIILISHKHMSSSSDAKRSNSLGRIRMTSGKALHAKGILRLIQRVRTLEMNQSIFEKLISARNELLEQESVIRDNKNEVENLRDKASVSCEPRARMEEIRRSSDKVSKVLTGYINATPEKDKKFFHEMIKAAESRDSKCEKLSTKVKRALKEGRSYVKEKPEHIRKALANADSVIESKYIQIQKLNKIIVKSLGCAIVEMKTRQPKVELQDCIKHWQGYQNMLKSENEAFAAKIKDLSSWEYTAMNYIKNTDAEIDIFKKQAQRKHAELKLERLLTSMECQQLNDSLELDKFVKKKKQETQKDIRTISFSLKQKKTAIEDDIRVLDDLNTFITKILDWKKRMHDLKEFVAEEYSEEAALRRCISDLQRNNDLLKNRRIRSVNRLKSKKMELNKLKQNENYQQQRRECYQLAEVLF